MTDEVTQETVQATPEAPVKEAKETATAEPEKELSLADQVWKELEKESTAEETESTENTEEAKTEEPAKESGVKEEATTTEDYKAKYEELQKKYQADEESKKVKYNEELKQNGFESEEHKKAYEDIVIFEYTAIANKINELPPEVIPQAYELLNKYATTLNPEDLRKVKSILSPEALEEIAISKQSLVKQKAEELNNIRIKQDFEQIKTKLVDFAGQNKEWLAGTQARSNAIASVVESLGSSVDLGKVKALIDTIEADAVKAYQESLKKDERKNMLKSPQGTSGLSADDKWFTKAQVDNMSESEYIRNSDKIIKQMELEKSGRLPRSII